MSDLLQFTAKQAKEGLAKGAFSARELAEAYMQAAEQTASLNNYVAFDKERTMAMADESDAAYREGRAKALEGIPVGVKDLFCTSGLATTACSAILKGFVPQYESTVTANLWADGAVMLGKLNCDEFAMGSANETSVLARR